MKSIVIGKSGGRGVLIDLDILITTRLLLTADSGGGKTFAIKRICEQVYGKVPVQIIDPEGEFAPLREKFGFVFVGKGGDTPADVRSAEIVAHRLLEHRASAICDISEMRPSERHIWVRTYIDALIEAPKKFRHPTIIVVDEAHMFCPEHGKGESEASDAMISLCTRGRKRGLCAVWATQRLAVLNKDASGMLLNRLVGPTFEDANLRTAVNILAVSKEHQQEFRRETQVMEPGNFWALGRAISKERILVRIGTIQTPHGHDATKYSETPPPAPASLAKLLPKLSDLPKQAEEKAKTEAELKKEIRELKVQLRSVPTKAVEVKVADPRAIERATLPFAKLLGAVMKILVQVNAIGFNESGLKPDDVKAGLELAARQIVKLANDQFKEQSREFEALKSGATRLIRQIEDLLKKQKISVSVDVVAGDIPTGEIKHKEEYPQKNSTTHTPRSDVNGDLTPYMQDILDGLADLEAIGKNDVSLALAGVASRKSHKSSTFERYRSSLAKMGYISYPSAGRIALTPEGRTKVKMVDDVLTSKAIQARALNLLTPYQQDMLRALIAVHPLDLSREALGENSGKQHTSSTFERYLSSLRTMEMVEYPGSKTVKAADWLFVE